MLARLKKSAGSNPLCLECGLCCNGVIFANGQLQPGDDLSRLQQLGLKLLSTRKPKPETRKFHQPCAAFDGCRCGIYSERPQYCRAFECALLKKFKAKKLRPMPRCESFAGRVAGLKKWSGFCANLGTRMSTSL